MPQDGKRDWYIRFLSSPTRRTDLTIGSKDRARDAEGHFHTSSRNISIQLTLINTLPLLNSMVALLRISTGAHNRNIYTLFLVVLFWIFTIPTRTKQLTLYTTSTPSLPSSLYTCPSLLHPHPFPSLPSHFSHTPSSVLLLPFQCDSLRINEQRIWIA